MKLSLCGIGAQKFCFLQNIIHSELICGQLDVYLQKWHKKDLYLQVIVK